MAVALLVALGEGLVAKNISNMQALGRHVVFLWPGQTSVPYRGLPKGRRLRLAEPDVEALRREVRGARFSGELEREQVRRALRAAREAGLRSLLYLTIGLPGETRDTVRETARFVRTLDWDFAEVHLAVAFPGTPLFQHASRKGLLALPLGGPRGGGAVPHLIRSEALSYGELAALRLRVLLELYGRGLRIARSAWKLPGGPLALVNLARMAVPKLGRNLSASWRLGHGAFAVR